MLSSIETSVLAKSFEYDDKMRLNEKTYAYQDGPSLTTSFTYDSVNRVLTKTMPNGEVTEYEYGSNSNIIQIVGVLASVLYNELGNVASREYSNSLTTSFNYDAQTMRLSTINTENNAGSLQTKAYSYDNVGNIIGVEDANTKAMTYDDINRLKTVHSNLYDYAYTYNSLGNIIEVQSTQGILVNSYDNGPVHAPSSFEVTYYLRCSIG